MKGGLSPSCRSRAPNSTDLESAKSCRVAACLLSSATTCFSSSGLSTISSLELGSSGASVLCGICSFRRVSPGQNLWEMKWYVHSFASRTSSQRALQRETWVHARLRGRPRWHTRGAYTRHVCLYGWDADAVCTGDSPRIEDYIVLLRRTIGDAKSTHREWVGVGASAACELGHFPSILRRPRRSSPSAATSRLWARR